MQWGPYERGPVFTLFEILSGALGPDSCLEGSFNRYSHLGTLWISDPDIATYANQTLGIPVYAAEFDIQETAAEQTWTWNLPGQPSSEISMLEVDGHAQPSTFTERIFWMNGTTISYMDLNQRYEVPTLRSYIGYGHMEEPMVAASSGIHEYTAPLDTNINTDWTGTVRTFHDYSCAEPV